MRRKMGKKYIVPIYCKFVNRSVVHEIMRRRHLLKYARNERNDPYIIEENLTPNRRLLWDSVQEKLTHFKSKWVYRGSIYVRKHANSKKIKVVSECVLNNLIAENVQTDASLPAHKEPVRKDPLRRANPSNQSKYDNRYANIVNSRHFPRRPSASLMQSKLPYQSSYSQYSNQSQLPQPIFSFRNTSFVDYRSSAF